ncbi:neutral zinc metallopeptidase [Isoptericola sp. NEAU-Y5]|uniref:Neutral zinc metallopeptidase n=1 Tax=Isoptericola luteus TaxID=2879484 RepID=A0ABS7ZEI0_9MICO|nr:neutral zinc metallopeptidase [Isoptericola sp. NEAU-Y5]MCA5893453.1 neutral zinc metallopeptidase [Isoptericola sp. NEAU-Y5]
MTFNEGGQFEGGRVRKGGGRRGAVVGGGIGAVVVALLAVFLGGDLGQVVGSLGGAVQEGPAPVGEGQQQFIDDCTAQEANSDRECRLSASVQSLDAYWEQVLPEQAGVEYVPPPVESFSGSTTTGCGAASSATGPFYCPPDQTIYVDVSFFDQLSSQFGAEGGPLAEMYVVAHEMGHHVEQLSGAMDAADRGGSGPESDSVRIELMADCLAGMWAGSAATVVDPDTGVTFLDPISQAELGQALDAAATVGDDHIQRQATGRITPEGFTHGTSEQRVRWFTMGYEGGTMQDCDALSADTL